MTRAAPPSAGRRPSAAPFVPDTSDLDALRAAADACRGCDLHRDATQAVFGSGGRQARLVLVGEQPGDHEDVEGEPFVGPAGRLLDRALGDAGIDRADAYVTNAVKHFKFTRRGTRRIHQKPTRTEVVACRPWLLAELGSVRPPLVVALGATAATSLLGPAFRVTAQRGEVLELPAEAGGPAAIVATAHPSAVLRDPDRDAAYDALVADLRVAASLLAVA